jgi:hypothetical protein
MKPGQEATAQETATAWTKKEIEKGNKTWWRRK